EYIIAKRAEKNLSRSEMAKRAGFTAQYAMEIERGRMIPAEDKIEDLINVLDLDEKTAFKLANKIPIRIYEKAKEEYYKD
ncbi:MAG TPA: helix-turn-helix transcriptional regulator, partial [Geobacterales bacterium]|nr:helix-turn-helix transcriptional regulator [Geobacterales bacterium]